MKRFVVLAVVLLLVMMVSSVSAHIVIDPPAEDVVPTDQFSLNNVIIDPPKYPDSVPGDSVSIEEGKATPILFGSEADSGDDLPTEEVSLNGGGTIIKIIVSS